jgi:hypothetical protein
MSGLISQLNSINGDYDFTSQINSLSGIQNLIDTEWQKMNNAGINYSNQEWQSALSNFRNEASNYGSNINKLKEKVNDLIYKTYPDKDDKAQEIDIFRKMQKALGDDAKFYGALGENAKLYNAQTSYLR